MEAQSREALLEEQRNEEKRCVVELEAIQSRAIQFERVFGVPTRMAVAMASAPHLQREEMRKWFEDGRLPCSFSLKDRKSVV